MADAPIQSSLFEEDYLLRELGQVAHVPRIALPELVARWLIESGLFAARSNEDQYLKIVDFISVRASEIGGAF